jgi:hypothetical protein
MPVMQLPHINTTNSRSGSGVRAYPERDYRKQLVIGTNDLNVVPQPAVGLCARINTIGKGRLRPPCQTCSIGAFRPRNVILRSTPAQPC